MTRRYARAGLTAILLLAGLRVAALAQALEAASVTAPAARPFLPDVPLSSLSATRDRPLFVPSRRAPSVAPMFAATPLHVDQPPGLTLLGIIRAPEGSGSAVVMDETNHTSVSLRLGDSRRGWVVRSIEAGAVMLQNRERTTRLTFQNAAAPLIRPAE